MSSTSYPTSSVGRLFRQPSSVQMEYIGMDVVRLTNDKTLSFCYPDEECCIVPICCKNVMVRVEKDDHDNRQPFCCILQGRYNVTKELSDFCYIGKGQRFTLSLNNSQTQSDNQTRIRSPHPLTGPLGTLCIARAYSTSTHFPPRYGPISGISLELRGRGQASRQCNNFMSPMVWGDDKCDKLCVVEVITPDGNWSSYPPHKHDEGSDGAINEEIYYFQMSGCDGEDYSNQNLNSEYQYQQSKDLDDNESNRTFLQRPYAFHRTFTGEQRDFDHTLDINPQIGKTNNNSSNIGGPQQTNTNSDYRIDDTVTVYPNDIYLVPKGFHGPTIAPPGYDIYYLNVLAGPNPKRSMQFCWMAEQEWIVSRQWRGLGMDRRLPLCRNYRMGGEGVVVVKSQRVGRLSGANQSKSDSLSKGSNHNVSNIQLYKHNQTMASDQKSPVLIRNESVSLNAEKHCVLEKELSTKASSLCISLNELMETQTQTQTQSTSNNSQQFQMRHLQSLALWCAHLCRHRVTDRKITVNLIIDIDKKFLNNGNNLDETVTGSESESSEFNSNFQQQFSIGSQLIRAFAPVVDQFFVLEDIWPQVLDTLTVVTNTSSANNGSKKPKPGFTTLGLRGLSFDLICPLVPSILEKHQKVYLIQPSGQIRLLTKFGESCYRAQKEIRNDVINDIKSNHNDNIGWNCGYNANIKKESILEFVIGFLKLEALGKPIEKCVSGALDHHSNHISETEGSVVGNLNGNGSTVNHTNNSNMFRQQHRTFFQSLLNKVTGTTESNDTSSSTEAKSESTIESQVLSRINTLISTHDIVIFSKGFCPFCFKAKNAIAEVMGITPGSDLNNNTEKYNIIVLELETENREFTGSKELMGTEIESESDSPPKPLGPIFQDQLSLLTNAGRSVPKVFVKGKFIGGGDDVQALAMNGGLEKKLKEEGIIK